MNFILYISFSGLFLMQSMGSTMDLCCELQKLPNLFDHYEEHQEFDGDSFLEFLAEDYLNDKDDVQGHHDDSDHDDLPFHGQHQCCHGYIFIAPLLGQTEVATLYFSTLTRASCYSFSLSSEYSESPFQPPKA
ncbi:hypothetical protein [Algoriphagus persicinus]|uniref:hypothetical protein n=1 Tax=Algoriphagus persicinus TaxID=3108754 RepID=UPI002B3A280F|nr:hypothetical protein [Algoriphagus sp. E1-3-M2]MEB2787099.1 hypothetical protein [Algoriphagus sp. E1-3-M2]